MGLLDIAKADIEQITSNLDEWSRPITLTAPDGTTLLVNGLHTKHHLGVDSEGNRINTKNAHISFSEKFLVDAVYPVRNLRGEVSLIDHKVAVSDSTGTEKTYVIRECYPNETIGLIVCILGDFA